MNTITYRHHNQDRQCDPYIIHAEQVTKKTQQGKLSKQFIWKSIYGMCQVSTC